MKGKIKAIIVVTLLAILLIEPLYLKIATAQNVSGTQDDTLGVWMFSAGTTIPAGAPTDDIIDRAVFYNLLDYIGDTSAEVYKFGWGPIEPITGQEDKTLAEVVRGLLAIDDFGFLANGNDDDANFDTGKNGYFVGGFDPNDPYIIVSDGTKATGVLGPSGATSAQQAEQAIDGYEIFIFEDAELSGMVISLSNRLGLNITFSIADLQVNPPTQYGADDTLVAIDLDALPSFDHTFIDTIRIKDDGITSPSTYGDTTLEIDAIATRKSLKKRECPVTFYTDPFNIGNITFKGETYTYDETDTFPYGTSGLATAKAPVGWAFDHWVAGGNVQLSSITDNPTTVTVLCGGNLTAFFRQAQCTVTFYTDPFNIGNITFKGETYTYDETDTFPYGTSGLATAKAPVGWAFDHWVATGNVQISSTTANPTTVTVLCGGNLTAVFKQIQCVVKFYTAPSTVGNITFKGITYLYGQSDTFPYGVSGSATANAPVGWAFDHWVTVGNVQVSSTTANPTTFTIKCGGNLTAFFKQLQCPVTFYTDPSTIGNITFKGETYTYDETDTFPYGTSGLAYANAPVGWAFDHWVATGNVQISSTTANPTTVTVLCGGNLTAVFKQIQCVVKFYTAPSTVGNITFKGVTYTYGQLATFPYGTSGLVTANAPEGWIFDHWTTVGNVQVSSTTANPTTFSITCGGNLTAVFIEQGIGDFGTIGYWKHVFYVWKTGKGTFKDYVETLLVDYLERINATSRVFSENYTLTMESAYDLLWSRDSSIRTRALKQCLASWLNWADGATTMTQMVDTNYDGIPDMTFGDAMTIVEDILRDPNSSREELEYAKNICDSINNM